MGRETDMVRRLGVALAGSSTNTCKRAVNGGKGAMSVVARVRPPPRRQASLQSLQLLSHSTTFRAIASSSVCSAVGGGSEGVVSHKTDKVSSSHDWAALVRDYGKSDAVSSSIPMEVPTIEATVRSLDDTGSRYSRRLREEGKLPGVLYGPGVDGDKERYLITVERRDIERHMRRLGDSIASTVFDLQLGEYKQRVLIRDLDRDPGTAMPIAVNFLRYRPGYPVKVPVCFINEELCLPLKRGGMLLSINRFIRVSCEGETLPEMLLADLTGAKSGQKIGLERVTFPPSVQPHEVQEDFVLGVVKGKNIVTSEVGTGETDTASEAT